MGQPVAALLQTKPNLGTRGYVTFDGASTAPVSVPDSAELSIVGDLSVIAHLRLDHWTPSAKQTIAGKLTTTGNQRSWAFSVDPDGTLELLWSTDGNTGGPQPNSSIAPTPDANGWCWIAAALDVFDADSGLWRCRFTESADGITWTSLGADVGSGPTSIFDSTAPLVIGSVNSGAAQRLDGSVDFVSISTGGTEVFRFDGITITSPAQTTIPTRTGQTITVSPNAALTAATDLRGMPAGIGDWRMFVERLNGFVDGTGDPFIVGMFKLGASADGGDDPKVGALGWEDLTGRWRGSSITRGADEPFGRPRVGECLMTLANRDGYLSPTENYADTRPGVVVRIGLASALDPRADGWIPVFTGLVDSWLPRETGARPGDHSYADSYVEVTLVETLSSLARINDNAVASQGSGEMFTARVARLLNAARWRYGTVRKSVFFAADAEALAGGVLTAADRGIPLQPTDMAKPRVEELYLTADSSSMTIRSDVTGAACITDLVTGLNTYPDHLNAFSWNGTLAAGWNGGGQRVPYLGLRPYNEDVAADLKRLVYDAETLVVANDPEHIVNDNRYARVGGSQQVAENKVSIGRFGRSSKPRTDLISTADLYALGVARDDNDRLSRTTFRIDAVQVTATGKDPLYTLCRAALDIGHSVRVTLEDNEPPESDVYANCRVRAITHEITPLRPGALAWTSTLAFDTAQLVGFPPGSILPGFSV